MKSTSLLSTSSNRVRYVDASIPYIVSLQSSLKFLVWNPSMPWFMLALLSCWLVHFVTCLIMLFSTERSIECLVVDQLKSAMRMRKVIAEAWIKVAMVNPLRVHPKFTEVFFWACRIRIKYVQSLHFFFFAEHWSCEIKSRFKDAGFLCDFGTAFNELQETNRKATSGQSALRYHQRGAHSEHYHIPLCTSALWTYFCSDPSTMFHVYRVYKLN